MKNITTLLVGCLLAGAVFAECSFDGHYERTSPGGYREVMVIQGDLIIGAAYTPDGRLMGTVHPHRIVDANCQRQSFVASTSTLDDDSALTFVGAMPLRLPPRQTYRMEGAVLNVPGRGLFFPAVNS